MTHSADARTSRHVQTQDQVHENQLEVVIEGPPADLPDPHRPGALEVDAVRL